MKSCSVVTGFAVFLLLLCSWPGGTSSAGADEDFWTAVEPDLSTLPANQVYPRGRVFPFAGFSGIPSRDKQAGYTVAGPVYVQAKEFLASAKQSTMPVMYPIGIHKETLEKFEGQPLPEEKLRAEILQQITPLVSDDSIAWWYLKPEELRHWRLNEINYLKLATETIRAADPKARPIWMYEPNHRTSTSLEKSSVFLDIIGKGCYANYAGYPHDRVWVRWSMEQQSAAIETLGGNKTSILVPAMFQNPPESDRARITEWVRHDVMLGLIHGAKGVVVYSLFRRREVSECFDDYYAAYSSMAKKVVHDTEIGNVCLFGEPRNDLVVTQTSGPETVSFTDVVEKVESASLTDSERESEKHHTYPTLSVREFAFGKKRYLFLSNSSYDQSVDVSIHGFPPKETLANELLGFSFFSPTVPEEVLTDTISGLGVRCYVFSQLAGIAQ